MPRIRTNFFYGTLSAPLSTGGSTVNSAALASFPTVAAPDYAFLVLDPPPTGTHPEVFKITAHSSGSTSATIVKGQDGTADQTWPSGTVIAQTAIASDYTDTRVKDPVRVVATGNITLSGTQTIDTIGVVAGDRVLAANQTTAAASGIYVVSAGAWTRAFDADDAVELNGATVLVLAGSTNAGKWYTQSATVVTVGTTAQTWTAIPTGGSAGNTSSATGSLTGGSTSEVITHNLGTRLVDITIRNNASPYDEIDCPNEATTVNTATIYGATALPAGYIWLVTAKVS